MVAGRPIALAGALALVLSAVAADESLDAVNVLERVQAWLDGTRDLRARFEQRLESGALGGGVAETGTMFLARPGRVRWDYDPPDAKVAIVVDGKTGLYLPEEEEWIEGTLDEDDGLLPVLLAGDRRLADLFDATLVATPSVGGRGSYRVRVVPKEEGAVFEAAVLAATPPSFALTEVDVLDPAGNRTVFRLDRIRRNRGIDDGVFRLGSPGGSSSGTRR